MAPETDIDTDNQEPVQFHRYVDLPGELRIMVIQEFIAALRKQSPKKTVLQTLLPFRKFAPFAAVHSEWQHEFEAQQELFGSLCLCTDDLPSFHKMLSQRRAGSLSKVGLLVRVTNAVVRSKEQMVQDDQHAAVISRASNLIVNSVATILSSVEHAIHTVPQATRAELELHTKIMIPNDEGHRWLQRILFVPKGIDCDFSQLPATHYARKFSQHWSTYGPWVAMGHPRELLLSPSSILTLVGRMPNLEEADVGISSSASSHAITALKPGACPRLKTLRIPAFPRSPPPYNLARWSACWGDKIETLEISQTHVSSFLQNLVQHQEISEAIAWPNLQVLKIGGLCRARGPRSSENALTTPGGPIDTLFAIASALPWLPRIRDMTINQHVGMIHCTDHLFVLVMKLHLGSGSSKLTIYQPGKYRGRRTGRRVPWGAKVPVELSIKEQMQDAAAKVQDAVQMHRGHDLEIVWPGNV